MSGFVIPLTAAKRRRQRIWGFVYLGVGLIYIVLLLFNWTDNESTSLPTGLMWIVFFLMLVIGGFPILVRQKPFSLRLMSIRFYLEKKQGVARVKNLYCYGMI